MDIHTKKILTLVYVWVLCLNFISYTITFSVNKCKSDPSWSKNSRKVLTADIFIYERTKVLRGSKNVGWIYLLNKGQQNTTTKRRQKHPRSKIFSVRRDVKMFSEENCPCGRQMPKQLWQRKKGGKYEWTEGTTIIYVNNVPLLLIISGKIKQKREGGSWHHACHPANFSHAN